MAMTEWEINRIAVGQKPIQIILCDDDPGFLKEIHSEIMRCFAKININAQVGEYVRAEDITLERFASCDMIFLDIDFDEEDYNGIDIARMLRKVNNRALVFFVTNFIDYAPAGYEVQAFRYVLKRDMTEMLERYILQAMEQIADRQEYLRLRDRDEIVDIPLEQITYLEVMDHSVSIHTGETAWELNATLSGLEEQLDSHGFLRVHKSYLVNMRHIRKFRSRECLMDNGTVLAVSERNYAQQKKKYLLWKGLE